MKDSVAQFFDDYAKRFNEALQGAPPDVALTIAAFADYFLESTPNNIIVTKNDETFKTAIPHGFDYYRSVGLQNMKICSKAITVLDNYHALVKIHWQSLYIKKEGNKMELGFDIHYIIRFTDDAVKIICYLSGDEQQFMKDNGLEPYQ